MHEPRPLSDRRVDLVDKRLRLPLTPEDELVALLLPVRVEPHAFGKKELASMERDVPALDTGGILTVLAARVEELYEAEFVSAHAG